MTAVTWLCLTETTASCTVTWTSWQTNPKGRTTPTTSLSNGIVTSLITLYHLSYILRTTHAVALWFCTHIFKIIACTSQGYDVYQSFVLLNSGSLILLGSLSGLNFAWTSSCANSMQCRNSLIFDRSRVGDTVYPKKYAHGICFDVLCCGYTLTDFPISIRLTSLALWQSNDCPSASKATLMNMDKYFMWIHYERLHNHNKAKHNKTVCIFLGIYCSSHAMGTESIITNDYS